MARRLLRVGGVLVGLYLVVQSTAELFVIAFRDPSR